jgi:hypothetical protein
VPTPTAPTTTPAAPTTPAPDQPGTRPARSRWTSVLVPVVVGLGLGPVDLLLQRVLPYPFAHLANSPSAWALVAFAVGWSDRVRGRWWPGVAGVLTLLLAVEGYYATAVVALGDDVASLTNSAALTWSALAVLAGAAFGTAGAWARSARPGLGPLGTSAAVAVLLAEAWLDLTRLSDAGDDAAYRHDLAQTAVLLLVLAVPVAVVAGRSAHQRVVGSVLALALALVGALAIGTLRSYGLL